MDEEKRHTPVLEEKESYIEKVYQPFGFRLQIHKYRDQNDTKIFADIDFYHDNWNDVRHTLLEAITYLGEKENTTSASRAAVASEILMRPTTLASMFSLLDQYGISYCVYGDDTDDDDEDERLDPSETMTKEAQRYLYEKCIEGEVSISGHADLYVLHLKIKEYQDTFIFVGEFELHTALERLLQKLGLRALQHYTE